MRCPKCQSGRVVEIDLTLKERRVSLRSCSECETRWWHREGELIELGEVLELATVRR
jgi:transcriptional regulator NrdR family protein